MQDVINTIVDQIEGYLPNLLAAIAILVVGWILALFVAGIFRRGLNRALRGRKLAEALAEDQAPQIGKWTGRIIFWVLMAFVLAAAFQRLELSSLSGPLDSMLQQFTGYLPQIFGAAVLLAIAWSLGTVLRFVVVRGLEKSRIGVRLAETAELEIEKPLSQTIGDVLLWVPLLLFLPAIMGVLELEGLLSPLQGMFDDLFGILPNLLGALLILSIGWFIAKILRKMVTGLLTAIGLDQLGEKAGMGPDAGPRRLSAVVGLLVYALVVIPATIAALDALQIEAISRPATTMLSNLLTAVPLLFGAAIVLGVAVLVGKIVSGLVTNVLSGLGFDRLFEKLGLKISADEQRRSPSEIVGYLTLVTIILMAAIESANLLGFSSLSALATEFFGFGTRLLLGMIIFGFGLYLGNLAYRSIPRGEGRWGALYGSAARLAIIVLATSMALEQTGVARDIVTLAFTLVLGAIAVAAALAFGLGARESAGKIVDQWWEGSAK